MPGGGKIFSIAAYASLGSNSDDGRQMLAKAVSALAEVEDAKILLVSPVFRTEPQDYTQQPWFVNQVVKIGIGRSWTALKFLRRMLLIEKSLGRTRGSGPRFGPRKIDIDLLLFGGEISHNEECILPHPRLVCRAFALVPLYAIEPNLEINGEKIPSLLSRLAWRLDADRIYQ